VQSQNEVGQNDVEANVNNSSANNSNVAQANNTNFVQANNTNVAADENDAANTNVVNTAVKNEAPQGETFFSMAYTPNGTPVALLDRDILKGVPRGEWVRAVKDNLRAKFPGGIKVANSDIKITNSSISELTHSRDTINNKKNDPLIYADKLRVTDMADDILKASRDFVEEAPKHKRKDGFKSFARGKVLMSTGTHTYSADVIVAHKQNGGMVLYDIINFETIAAPTIKKNRTFATQVPATTAAAEGVKPVLNESIVAQENNNVKGENDVIGNENSKSGGQNKGVENGAKNVENGILTSKNDLKTGKNDGKSAVRVGNGVENSAEQAQSVAETDSGGTKSVGSGYTKLVNMRNGLNTSNIDSNIEGAESVKRGDKPSDGSRYELNGGGIVGEEMTRPKEANPEKQKNGLFPPVGAKQMSIDSVRSQYEGTNEWMKAPNGEKTNLSVEQWLLVRTPEFKAWFGDWETVANYNWLIETKPIAVVKANIFADGDGSLVDMVSEYYAHIGGKVERKGLGVVNLTRRGIKSSTANGVGRAKASAFKIVPDIIKDGRIIDRQGNSKGGGYDTVVIAAPVKIEGRDYIAEVVVKPNNSGNSFYLHGLDLESITSITAEGNTAAPPTSSLIIAK
jgi:hypothetical protein